MTTAYVQEILTLREFHNAIADGPVVVDFTAEWCSPCRQISPKVDELAMANPHITFLKVDVDRAHRIADISDVRSMPTFHVYMDGQLIETVIGANLPALRKVISKLNGPGRM